ncbi:hypothetical protein [Sulfitobacter sp. JL08]|uniref:hypothetical protein n=1 Tax=unclassified Sulfitobacter TaxID=196795 RepID=UPI001966CC2D|nr:hypothetical protein [Sulfitobacter sp. JL08]
MGMAKIQMQWRLPLFSAFAGAREPFACSIQFCGAFVAWRFLITAGAIQSYVSFFPPISSAGLPARELAVALTLGFSCFGFLASLLPRLPPLPFVIVFPFSVGWFHAETIDTLNFENDGDEGRRH